LSMANMNSHSVWTSWLNINSKITKSWIRPTSKNLKKSEHIDGLVAEFTDKGYLDNVKYAAWYSELLTRRNKSDRQIKAELFKKGIDREVVADTLEQGGADETARLKQIIAKKAKLSRYKNDPKKLMQYLVAQGFSWQLVKETLAGQSEEGV
jgi:SOS response regulatory protein OraA/RecX